MQDSTASGGMSRSAAQAGAGLRVGRGKEARRPPVVDDVPPVRGKPEQPVEQAQVLPRYGDHLLGPGVGGAQRLQVGGVFLRPRCGDAVHDDQVGDPHLACHLLGGQVRERLPIAEDEQVGPGEVQHAPGLEPVSEAPACRGGAASVAVHAPHVLDAKPLPLVDQVVGSGPLHEGDGVARRGQPAGDGVVDLLGASNAAPVGDQRDPPRAGLPGARRGDRAGLPPEGRGQPAGEALIAGVRFQGPAIGGDRLISATVAQQQVSQLQARRDAVRRQAHGLPVAGEGTIRPAPGLPGVRQFKLDPRRVVRQRSFSFSRSVNREALYPSPPRLFSPSPPRPVPGAVAMVGGGPDAAV